MQRLKKLFYKAYSTSLTVTSEHGFHLRPVAQFSQLALTFACDITLTQQNKVANAKNLNETLALTLNQGDIFTLTTQGKNATKALEALRVLFNMLMKNEKNEKHIEKTLTQYNGSFIAGEIITQGVVIAPLHRYETDTIQEKSTLSFQEALNLTIQHLDQEYRCASSATQSEISLAQKALLEDIGKEQQTVEAFEATIVKAIKALENSQFASKIRDYEDILKQVKMTLGLKVTLVLPKSKAILLAKDLLPSEIALLEKSTVCGVILEEGSMQSHTAILLRAAGIPSIIATLPSSVLNTEIILDALSGTVVISPTRTDIEQAEIQQEKYHKKMQNSQEKRFEKACTSTGISITVLANVGDILSAKVAKKEGAEGIGLLRSEFLFKQNKPSLEVQTKAYQEIFQTFDEITVRTLDVGGDKSLPYLQIPPENNPFLGLRGVRLFRTHPQLLREQLHAIFLAANGKKVKIMFPMVSSIEEFTSAKQFAQDVAKQYHLDISNILFGIMIEVPSVLFLLAKFNEVVDFYSVGTNDLTQYLFAIERTHPLLKTDELSDVVFSALEMILTQSTKPVSLCGELAANPKATQRLIALGMTQLSVSPKSIAQTKENIRHV